MWAKANPNYGISVKPEDLRAKVARAESMPSALNSILRLHFNVWTETETQWIAYDAWQACAGMVDADGLRGRVCYAGLDLSSNTDVTALVLVFPPDQDRDPFRALCRFWIPSENMAERIRRDRVPYDAWVRQGFVSATPGNVIDYAYILAELDDLASRYDIQELAFDRWGATKIQTDMQDQGLNIVQFGQGYASMSPAMKQLETLILQGQIAHGGNPVLAWMAANLVAAEDPAGNIKPDKVRSREKIDGMVALIMALDRAVRNRQESSVYEDRGMVVI